MAKKSLLSEAIAEARQIRETALENAKKQLEESLTPGIKKMLAHKLNEELELEDNIEEESLEESAGLAGFKEVKPEKSHTEPVNEAEGDEEEPEEEPTDEDPVDDNSEQSEESSEEDPESGDEESAEEEVTDEDPEATEDAEETSEEEPAEESSEEIDDDTPLSDIKVGDLKNMIADMISASVPATEPAPEGNQGVDMTPAPVQGTGEEEAPVSGGPQPAGMEAEDPAAEEAPEQEESDEEIDLSELLKELEEEAGFEANDQRGKVHDKNDSLEGFHQDSETKDNGIQENKKAEHGPDCDCEACRKAAKAEKDLKKAKKELAEALQTVKELKDTLNEVNLVNSKLVYMTRTLNSRNLSESQKSVVVHTFDKAESIKEVKDIYKMLQESLNIKTSSKAPRKMLSEHRGSASRFAGNASRTKAVEVDETVKRFQRLAGIISED